MLRVGDARAVRSNHVAMPFRTLCVAKHIGNKKKRNSGSTLLKAETRDSRVSHIRERSWNLAMESRIGNSGGHELCHPFFW